VVAGAVALLWLAGGLNEMLYIILHWDPKYAELRSRVPLTIRIPEETLKFLFRREHLILNLLGVLAVVGCSDLVFGASAGRSRWLLPGWAAASLTGIYVQGKFFEYHWLPVLPPLGLLAGHGLVVVRRLLRNAGPVVLAPVGMAAVALLLTGALATGYWAHLRTESGFAVGGSPPRDVERRFRTLDFSFKADAEVATFLREQAQPTDRIYVWGFEPLVYFLADRRPASRFLHTLPLVTRWSPPEWRLELVEDLERVAPSHILVLHNDVFPWATGTVVDSATHLANYPELGALLSADYRMVERIEDFAIYERRGRGSAEPT
jgi:hypothetical protein